MLRLALPILALALGAALAVGLVSCGGRDEEGLLPGDNAQQIVDNLNQVELDAANGDCVSAAAAVDQVQAQISELGSDVNAQLRQRLAEGAARLEQVVSESCEEATVTTPPETVTGETETETEETQTETDQTQTETDQTQTETETDQTQTETTTPTTPTTPTGGGITAPPGGQGGEGG